MEQQPAVPQPPSGPPAVPPAVPRRGRFRTGLYLMGVSWKVVKSEPSLLALPIISMVAGVLLLAGFAGIFWSTGAISRVIDVAGSSTTSTASFAQAFTPVDYVLMFLYYFLAAFVVVFFNAAIIAIASKRLDGEDATVGDGLRMASKHAGKIAAWALITATVGLILRAIQERVGIIGDIIIGLIGVAWTLITFFVVPVMLFEPVGAVGAIKRSATIFKQKWGEQIAGSVGITAILGIIGFVGVMLGVGIAFALSVPLGVAFAVIVVLAVSTVSGAVTGVFNTALYRYATTGQVGGGFTEVDMASAFVPKKQKR